MNLRMNTANCFKYSSKLMVMISELKSIQMEFWEWLSGKGTGNHKTYFKTKDQRYFVQLSFTSLRFYCFFMLKVNCQSPLHLNATNSLMGSKNYTSSHVFHNPSLQLETKLSYTEFSWITHSIMNIFSVDCLCFKCIFL